MRLADEHCAAVMPGTPPLTPQEAEKLAREVPHWTIGDAVLEREFKFDDFKQAMDFVDDVAEVAQEQDHHPDFYISYDRVRLEFTTHKVSGLSRNDFIMAAKVDELAEQ